MEAMRSGDLILPHLAQSTRSDVGRPLSVAREGFQEASTAIRDLIQYSAFSPFAGTEVGTPGVPA